MSSTILSQAIPIQAKENILKTLINNSELDTCVLNLIQQDQLHKEDGSKLIKLNRITNETEQQELLSDSDLLRSCLKTCLIVFKLICDTKLEWKMQEVFISQFHAITEQYKDESMNNLRDISDIDEFDTQLILKSVLELGIKQIPGHALDCTVISMTSYAVQTSRDSKNYDDLLILINKLLSGLWKPAGNNNVTLSRLGGWVTLTKLLENQQVREYFDKNDGIRFFAEEIKDTNYNKIEDNLQEYQWCCYCIWMMSQNLNISETFSKNGIQLFIQTILKHSSTDKIIRVIIQTFLNVSNQSTSLAQLYELNLLRQCDLLLNRKFKDQDIQELILDVIKILEQNMKEYTSWDKQLKELKSGNLKWSPIHSDNFYADNIKKFEDNNFDAIKLLIAVLNCAIENKDDTTLEVACQDLGEFMRFNAHGRKVITKFEAKKPLMSLLEHKNAKVKRQALLATQKMMLINWKSVKDDI